MRAETLITSFIRLAYQHIPRRTGTVRLALLKLGAKITVSVRRVLIAIASACPYQDILAIAYQRSQAISDSG